MALSLVNEEWVDNVTLFVVEEDHRNRDPNLMGTNKLKIFYYPTYNVDQQTANIYEFSDFSAAHCLNKSTNNLNLEILKSIHGDIKKYFEIANDQHLIQALCLRQYQVCINELRYYPLFPILQLIECKHIVATSNMPLESIYYHYLGLLPNIIENGIPVVLRIKTEKQQGESSSSNNPHELAVLQKKKEIEKFDIFFEQIGGENYFENIIKYVIKFIFVNTQSLIDFEAMSYINDKKIINIGGIAIQQNNQNLNIKEASIFNFAFQNNKQIIFVSFGTMIDSRHLTDIQINNLVRNFGLFSNYIFIWAIKDYDNKIYKLNNYDNIKREDRVNQTAILAHPLTILFISHCGINSSLEAVKYGKPLLCAPFIADQFYNSQALASREVAKVVDDRIFENIFQNILDALK
uniref:glucuronosyltransferase n=1 Tax=Meloidogyne incognita TaxID=6306 RepID=A0A914N6J7_MELIC